MNHVIDRLRELLLLNLINNWKSFGLFFLFYSPVLFDRLKSNFVSVSRNVLFLWWIIIDCFVEKMPKNSLETLICIRSFYEPISLFFFIFFFCVCTWIAFRSTHHRWSFCIHRTQNTEQSRAKWKCMGILRNENQTRGQIDRIFQNLNLIIAFNATW